jgi:K+-sensing histidine kinase KdpD
VTARRLGSFLLRYGMAALSVAAALLLLLLADKVPDPSLAASALVVPILLTSLYGGLGAGLLAAVLATLAVSYLFSPLVMRLGPEDLIRAGVFSLVALVVSWLYVRLEEEARERERLVAQLEDTIGHLEAEAANFE